MIDEKALRYAHESNGSIGYHTCRGIIEAYEQARRASLPQDSVERVAIAISQWMNCEKLPQPPRWDRLQEATRQAYRNQARAALHAADDAEALVAKLEKRKTEYPTHVTTMLQSWYGYGIDDAVCIIRKHFATPTTKEGE